MKKMLSAAAALAVALFAAPALAGPCGSACGSNVASDCGSSCGDVAKVAMAGCSGCGSEGLVAKNAAAELGIVPGGAVRTRLEAGSAIGQKAPDFTLSCTQGNTVTLSDHRDSVVVVVFYNHACPFVVEMWDRLGEFTTTHAENGVKVLAIDPGIDKPVEDIARHAANRPYPILVNRDSDVARAFNASRTPEVFVIDREGVIRYHGAFDNGQAGSGEGQRLTFAEDAVRQILAGEEVTLAETRAFGCTIKWNTQTASAPAATSPTM